MPKLPILSSKELIRILRYLGFEGSHSAFVKRTEGKARLVIIPQRDEIPRGTLLSIIEQTGLTKAEFVKILEKL